MDALMIPIVQAPKAQVAAAVEAKTQTGQKAGSNFSDYMEKKMAAERRGKDNMLGMQKSKAASVAAVDKKKTAAASEHKEKGDEASTIAAL